jgi:hypothetical protein
VPRHNRYVVALHGFAVVLSPTMQPFSTRQKRGSPSQLASVAPSKSASAAGAGARTSTGAAARVRLPLAGGGEEGEENERATVHRQGSRGWRAS